MEALMNGGRSGCASIVEDLDGDPLGTRSHPDTGPTCIATDHDTHRPGAVTAQVGGGCVLSVGIKPTVRATPPAGGKIWVSDIHTGIHACHDYPLPGVAHIPQYRRVDVRDIDLRGCISRNNIDCVRGDLQHIRVLRELGDHIGCGGHGKGIVDPESFKPLYPALVKTGL